MKKIDTLRFAVPMLVGLVGLAIAAAACGGTSSSDKTSTAAAGSRPATTQSAATPASGGAESTQTSSSINVVAKDFSFDPTDVDGSPGTVSISIDNQGSSTHTLTVYEDEGYTKQVGGSGTVPGGTKKTFSVTLGKQDYYYRCDIHPSQMQGEIKID
jgi:plastocyanin